MAATLPSYSNMAAHTCVDFRSGDTMDLTQTTTSTCSDNEEETVEHDGVRMTKAEAKDAAEERYNACQVAAANGAAISESDAETEAYADSKASYENSFIQANWEVELIGNPQDIYSLIQSGGMPDYFRVWGGIDDWNDCPSDRYSFNSLYFNGHHDPEVIWQYAYELVSLFNGASELFGIRSRKQVIREINFCGKPVQFSEQARVISLLGRPPMSLRKWTEYLGKATQTSPRLTLLILGTENEDVYMMLKYLGFEPSWSNYYKLLETMETHAKLKGASIPGTAAARERFTNNANNFSLVGYDARHGLKPAGKKNSVTVMTIEQAHDYISGVCKAYLNTVYPEYFKLQ